MFGKEDIGVNWLFPDRQRWVVVANDEDIDQADSWPVTRTQKLTERDQSEDFFSCEEDFMTARTLSRKAFNLINPVASLWS
jgi:hypothetical protein